MRFVRQLVGRVRRRWRVLAAVATIGVLPAAVLMASAPGPAQATVQSAAGTPIIQSGGAVIYEQAVPGGTMYFGEALAGHAPVGLPPALEAKVSASGLIPQGRSISVVPQNATGWSQDVFIHLYSVGTSGPMIRYWWSSTTAIYGYHCAGTTYWNGNGNNDYRYSGTACLGTNSYQRYWYAALTFGSGRTFNGQTLCNTWTNPPFPGNACEGVS